MKKLELNIKLENIPKAAKVAIAVAPTAIAIGLFVFMAIMPKIQKVDALRAELTTQETEIAKSQSMVSRLDDLKRENAKLKKNLMLLQERLPEEKEVSSLLRQISDKALESGLKIMSWKPSARRKHSSGIVYEIPVSVAFQGSYHELGNFFASLTELDRIVNVSDIKLAGPRIDENKVSLGITFTAVTFTAVSEAGLAE